MLEECSESVATIELEHGSFVTGGSGRVILQEGSTVLNIWHILIVGPVGTPYEGGVFPIRLELPQKYPFGRCPSLWFACPAQMYHPNSMEHDGYVHDLFHSRWSPASSITQLLNALCTLLQQPLTDACLRTGVGTQYCTDRKEFDSDARRHWKDATLDVRVYCEKHFPEYAKLHGEVGSKRRFHWSLIRELVQRGRATTADGRLAGLMTVPECLFQKIVGLHNRVDRRYPWLDPT